ncbi:hypothetical protein Tco_0831002 [Tanacetum coccineum]
MSSSSKSTHDYSRKLRRAILEPWRQSHNLPPSPLPNRNTPTSPSTTNSSPSLSPPQNPSPNQITHELHHLSNLLEINLQQAIDATNPSPPTSPCIPPPSLDQKLKRFPAPIGPRPANKRKGISSVARLKTSIACDPILDDKRMLSNFSQWLQRRIYAEEAIPPLSIYELKSINLELWKTENGQERRRMRN